MFFKLRKERIEYLRRTWGNPLEKHRDMELIAAFHNLLTHNKDELYVDGKTWNDLDLDSIFSIIDRNISGIGQQYLYHLLHKYEGDENKLKQRLETILTLKRNQELRENIQINLFGLRGISSYFVTYLVLSENLPNTKLYPLFYLFPILTILFLLLISFKGIFLLAALAILITNLVVNKIFSKKVYEYFTGFSSLNSLINSAISISKISTESQIEEIELLKQKRSLLASLKTKLGYLVIDKESLNELTLTFIEYLNMFFLFDIIAYYRSANVLIKNQKDIYKVFESVASLDSSISIASYLEDIPFYSVPSFNKLNSITFRDLYHPLIKGAIPNSIENLKESILITGSNMSGKTTFIKTIGINFIFAQTIYISLAQELCIPNLNVKTTIKRNDDLKGGKSYFFVEIEELNTFLKLSDHENKYLFLIDEIFRGTNTIERLAASVAVLKYLDKNNKVFVTTHDIELQELLENNFKMYHFSEQVENEKFFFNYKIKEGPCSAGNAIKLLKLMNYPDSIITEANTVVKKLMLSNSSITDQKLI